MFLTAENLPHYLLGRELIDEARIRRGQLVIFQSQRRNRNFIVQLETPSDSLFVKQPVVVVPETVLGMQREFQVYAAKEVGSLPPELADALVDLRDFDARRNIMVLTLFPAAESLLEHHLRLGMYPARTGWLQGNALRILHSESLELVRENRHFRGLAGTPPWILSMIGDAEKVMPNMSPALRQVVGLMRSSRVISTALPRLLAAWPRVCLTHGDVKWENFMIAVAQEPLSGRPRRAELKILDWELADIGDPAWDVACAFAAYVQHELMIAAETRPSKAIDVTAFREAVLQLWTGYAGPPPWSAALHAQLLRVVELVGVRLLLTVFEALNGSVEVTAAARALLALGEAILRDPVGASDQIFGFSTLRQSGVGNADVPWSRSRATSPFVEVRHDHP